jgi:PhnB protein
MPQATTLTPYLCVKDGARALAFYKEAFGAAETLRIDEPSGKLGHAELNIGGALLSLASEYPEYNALSPETIGGTPIKLHLTVPDVDAAVDRAVRAGATLVRPVENQFYGHRRGEILDPFGHRWLISTEIEHLTNEEIVARAKA